MSGRRFTFAPDSRLVRKVRSEARSAAAALGAPADACDAVALVVDELVNNALEHGAQYRSAGRQLSLALSLQAGRIAIDFVDPEMPESLVLDLAAAFAEAANGMPSLESERGRGLFLISIYLEELRVAVADGGGMHLHGRLADSSG